MRVGIFFEKKVKAINTNHIIVYIAWKNYFKKKISSKCRILFLYIYIEIKSYNKNAVPPVPVNNEGLKVGFFPHSQDFSTRMYGERRVNFFCK